MRNYTVYTQYTNTVVRAIFALCVVEICMGTRECVHPHPTGYFILPSPPRPRSLHYRSHPVPAYNYL